MTEYDVWFEVYKADEFQWEFVADFDTCEEAEAYIAEHEFGEYRIRKLKGQA